MRDVRCRNFNHSRLEPPVRACPMCGGTVNVRIVAKVCRETDHVPRRKNGDLFCVDCGLALRSK